MARAQRFQWYLEKGFVTKVWDLPEGTETTQILHILADLGERFETLRTVFDSIDGELQQVVSSDMPAVEIIELPPDSADPDSAAMLHEFDRTCHAQIGAPPIKFYILRQSGTPRWVVMLSDHAIIDGWSAGILDRHVSWTGTGPVLVASHNATVVHPIELSRIDNDPSNEERRRGRAYLEEHFSAMPGNFYPPAVNRPGNFFRCSVLSHSGGDIFRAVLRNTETLPSAAALTAFLCILEWQTGNGVCSVNVSAQNRYNATLRRVMGTTAQRLPIIFPTADDGDAALGQQVQKRLDTTLSAGRYEPLDLVAVRAREQLRRNRYLSTDLAFNFRPPPPGWTHSARHGTRIPPDGVRFSTTREESYEYGASLSVSWHTQDLVELSLHGSHSSLPGEQGAALLKATLHILRRVAAGGSWSAGDAAASVGLQRFRPQPGWERVSGTWINRDHLREVLIGHPGVVEAAVTAGPDTLLARVRANAGVHPSDLRRRVQNHLGRSGVTALPDRIEMAHLSGDGRCALNRPPGTEPERAILTALKLAHTGAEACLDECYVQAGGDLRRYPRFLAALLDLGYEGLTLPDLMGMRTVRDLATELRSRADSRPRPA